MAKYSTGRGGGSPDGGACELCGAESDTLRSASIAGATLAVCPSCAPHDDRGPASRRGPSEQSGERKPDRRRTARQAARLADAASSDPDYWIEHGTNYEDDPLPYLVSRYGDVLETARQSAGFTIDELAEEAGIAVADVEAVEQNRAARAGVGGSAISALEEVLDIELVESTD